MPAIARASGVDSVFSFSGAGKKCALPLRTSTGVPTVPTVLVGGVPVVVQGDIVGLHPARGCAPDISPLSTHSVTVFVGGRGVGRIGDRYGIDNIITSGFSTVFVGS